MSDSPTYGFDTLQIHAGSQPDPATGARQVPIYQNTAYVFRDADHAARLFNLQEVGYIYSRLTNPTVSALQERVATLEGGVGGVGCSSGHAAQILALFPMMSPGDNIVVSTRLYGGTVTQFSNTIKRFGWSATFVDFDDVDAIRAAADPVQHASKPLGAARDRGFRDPATGPRNALVQRVGIDRLQQVVDGFLDLQDVQVDIEVGKPPAYTLHRPRGDELRDRRYGSEGQFRLAAPVELVDRKAEVPDLLVDLVELIEQRLGFRRRHEQACLALEQPDTEGFLGVLDEPADARRRHVEQAGGAVDRAGQHDRTDHLDLPKSELTHGGPASRRGARSARRRSMSAHWR